MNEPILQKSEDERYVTWQEGAELLGLKRNAFYYLVESGQVRERRTGPRDGRYNLADILQVKAMRASHTPRKPHKPHRRKPAPVVIDWLQAADMPACLRLDMLVYDEMYMAEAAVYQSWRKKNTRLSFAAFDARDRNICLAYAGLIPLPEQVCLDILRGERDDKSITADEVESYERPGAYSLLAISAVTHPDRPDLLYALLYRHMQFWQGMYPERYIKKIYAQAVSERGELLVQHLFMAPRPDLAYNAFEIDMARPSASKIIRHFQKQLEQIAPLPAALQYPPPYTHSLQSPPAQPAIQQTPESHTAIAEYAPAQNRIVARSDALPDDLVSWWSFADTHHMAHSTIAKAVKVGRLPVVRGEWKSGRASVKEALDASGRYQFWQLYHSNLHFQPCHDCPHALT